MISFNIDAAKREKLFYVVANALVFRKSDMRVLLLKRSEREVANPCKWATIGGKLEWKDFLDKKPNRKHGNLVAWDNPLEQVLRREIKEEAGIDVGKEMYYVDSCVFNRPDNVPVVLVKFAMFMKTGRVIKIDKNDFTEYRFFDVKEAKKEPDVLGSIPFEISLATKILQKYGSKK